MCQLHCPTRFENDGLTFELAPCGAIISSPRLPMPYRLSLRNLQLLLEGHPLEGFRPGGSQYVQQRLTPGFCQAVLDAIPALLAESACRLSANCRRQDLRVA